MKESFFRQFVFFALLVWLPTHSSHAFFGARQTEAVIRGSPYFFIRTSEVPSGTEINRLIRGHLQLFGGPFRSSSSIAFFSDAHILSRRAQSSTPGTIRIDYSFEVLGEVSNIWEDGPYPLSMPLWPLEIETKANGKCWQKYANHPGKAFWYYWAPLTGCNLLENTDYVNLPLTFERKTNTQQTFPEYDRLLRKTDNGSTLRFDIFGTFEEYDDDDWALSAPSSGAMLGRDLKKRLLKRQFKSHVWTEDEIKSIYPGKEKNPYVEEFYLSQGNGVRIVVRFILAMVGFERNSSGFRHFYNDALANSSVIYYNGHSGVGRNLNLALLKEKTNLPFSLDPSYQLILLYGCYSYRYYAKDYFLAKEKVSSKGELDMITTATEGGFAIDSSGVILWIDAITSYFATGKKASYQELIKTSPFLDGVVGDEDNAP